MLEKLKNNYLWLCLAILLAALGLDYLSSSMSLITKEVDILKAGQIVKQSILTYPFYANVLNLISNFLYTLAAAVFVSVFVTTRVEEARKREHEEEIRKLQESVNVDVFDALFKKLVPEEIFAAVKDGIINNKIVRKNAQWLYDFRSENAKIFLRQTLKYEMHNLSQEHVENPICIEMDKGAAASDILTHALSTIEGVETVSFYLDGKQENVGIFETDHGNGKKDIRFNIIIPPLKHADVTLVFDLVFDSTPINETFFTSHPIINATLIVNFPKKYHFDIFQALSTELVCTLNEEGRKIYEAKGGILPNQGFVYKLRKREKDDAGSHLTKGST